VPEDSVEDVIASVLGAITIEVADDFVCAGLPLSLTVTVNVAVPLAVGVPEITPVPAARLRPVGRVPEVIDQM
jgi:hypothetical protein